MARVMVKCFRLPDATQFILENQFTGKTLQKPPSSSDIFLINEIFFFFFYQAHA